MGKSAKLHKRVKKTKLPSSASHSNPGQATSSSTQAPAQIAKKKSNLKTKASKGKLPNREGGVLGSADYVSLLMGGRRKAQEEALKLPQDDEEMS